MKSWKIASSGAFLSVSFGVIYPTITGQLFPGVQIGLLAATLCFAPIVYSSQVDRNEALFSITSIIVATGVLRWYIYEFPSSFIGFDPDKYAKWTISILDTGHTFDIPNNFYQTASYFMVLPASTSEITGLAVRHSLGIYVLLIGIQIPLLSVIFANHLTGKGQHRGQLIGAAIIGGVLALSTRIGYWPIPQTLAAILFQITIFLFLNRYMEDESFRYDLIIILFLISQILTHKFTIFAFLIFIVIYFLLLEYDFIRWIIKHGKIAELKLLSGFLITAAWVLAASLFSPKLLLLLIGLIGLAATIQIVSSETQLSIGSSGNKNRVWNYILISLIFLVVQWTLLTRFLSTIMYNFYLPFQSTGVSVEFAVQNYSHAIPSNANGFLEIFFHRSNILITLLLVTIGSIPIYVKGSAKDKITLSALFSILIFIPTSMSVQSSFGIGIQRLAMNVEAITAGIIPVTVLGISKRRSIKTIGLGLLFMLVIFQSFAAMGVPDYPHQYRAYLTDSEVEGKEFSNEYIHTEIHTDVYYAHESVDVLNGNAEAEKPVYVGESESLLNGTLLHHDYQYVLVRPEIEVYRMRVPGSWKLTWEPENRLDLKYSKTYTNGESTLYWEERR